MRYYTFTLPFLVEPSVSDIQTVAPTCPYFGGGGGGGGVAKYGHARILANAEIYGQSLNSHQFKRNFTFSAHYPLLMLLPIASIPIRFVIHYLEQTILA